MDRFTVRLLGAGDERLGLSTPAARVPCPQAPSTTRRGGLWPGISTRAPDVADRAEGGEVLLAARVVVGQAALREPRRIGARGVAGDRDDARRPSPPGRRRARRCGRGCGSSARPAAPRRTRPTNGRSVARSRQPRPARACGVSSSVAWTCRSTSPSCGSAETWSECRWVASTVRTSSGRRGRARRARPRACRPGSGSRGRRPRPPAPVSRTVLGQAIIPWTASGRPPVGAEGARSCSTRAARPPRPRSARGRSGARGSAPPRATGRYGAASVRAEPPARASARSCS